MRGESERAVQERIDATRDRIGRTIEEIGDRVNPDRVQRELKARARQQVEDVKDNVKTKARSTMRDIEHEVNEAGRGIWDTIRDNPIPAGMVGVGLAWLMANGSSNRGQRPRYSGYRAYPEDTGVYSVGATGYTGYTGYTGGRPVRSLRTEEGYGVSPDLAARGPRDEGPEESGKMDAARERAGEAADEVRHRASDAAHRAKDRAEGAMDSARESVSHAADEASHRMHDARDQVERFAGEVGHRARRAERRVEHMVEDNPLAAGMVAAALGFTAGLMIPETRREHEMLGPTRERVKDRAQRSLRDAGERAKDVARETAAETSRRAVDEVMGDSGKERSGEQISEPGR